jgi:hypothetical protein
MTLKKCGFCGNDVPAGGQCNKCGFIDGLARQPSDDEYRRARQVNKKADYKQFENIDMLLLEE